MWQTRCEATTLKGRRCTKKRVCEHFCKIHDPDYNNCPVCYYFIEQKVILSCGHKFCKECIFTWICKNKFTCPMCRIEIMDHMLLRLAWDYGVEKKLLYLVNVSVYNTNVLTQDEYNTIEEVIIKNQTKILTTADFLFIVLELNIGTELIFNKLTKTPKLVKQLVILPDGSPEPGDEEYYQIVNNFV
jgi:hypothetical protein